MEVDEVLLSSSFDGRSPRVATKGDLVTGIVNLYLEVLEYRTSNQEGSVSRNHKDLKTSKDSTNIDGQMDGPFSSAAGVSSKMEGLVHRSETKMVKVTATGLKYTEVLHQGVVANKDTACAIVQSSKHALRSSCIHVGSHHVGIALRGLGFLRRWLRSSRCRSLGRRIWASIAIVTSLATSKAHCCRWRSSLLCWPFLYERSLSSFPFSFSFSTFPLPFGRFSFGRSIGGRWCRRGPRRRRWNCHHGPKPPSSSKVSKSSTCIQVRGIHFLIVIIRGGVIVLVVGCLISPVIIPIEVIRLPWFSCVLTIVLIVRGLVLFHRKKLFMVVLIVILASGAIHSQVSWLGSAVVPSSSRRSTFATEATWWLVDGPPVVLPKEQKHGLLNLYLFHSCSNMSLDQLTLFSCEAGSSKHQPTRYRCWYLHSKLLNLSKVFTVLRGVGEKGLRWLAVKAKEKLLKSPRHLYLLIVLEACVQHGKGLGEAVIFIHQLVRWVLDLPPSQAIQASQQIDGGLLLLVLKVHLPIVQSNPKPPFPIVSYAVVENGNEVVLRHISARGGGCRLLCRVHWAQRGLKVFLLRYQCQLGSSN